MYDYDNMTSTEDLREESFLKCVQDRIKQERSDKSVISADDIMNLVIELNVSSTLSKIIG